MFPKEDFIMPWKPFILEQVTDFCQTNGNRTFHLKDFIAEKEENIRLVYPRNNTWKDKVRQTLQFLRDDGVLTFVDQRGTYTLRTLELLKGEVEDEKVKEVLRAHPEKREYLIEAFARDRGWVKQAKEFYGHRCLYEGCENTFKKPNGALYIEVHHIIPLCLGGEEGIWNLAPVCAHHHKMAHFADKRTRVWLTEYLTREAEERSRGRMLMGE